MASLAGVLPELRDAEAHLRQLALAKGITYSIADFGGIRSLSDTTRILRYRDNDYAVYVNAMRRANKTPMAKELWRPIAPFGGSMHNFGAAFDVSIITGNLSALGALAPQVGLRWGGNFKSRKDYPHFELPISLNEAKAKWEALGNVAGEVSGLPAVALFLGNIPENKGAWIIGAVVVAIIAAAIIIRRRGRHV